MSKNTDNKSKNEEEKVDLKSSENKNENKNQSTENKKVKVITEKEKEEFITIINRANQQRFIEYKGNRRPVSPREPVEKLNKKYVKFPLEEGLMIIK